MSKIVLCDCDKQECLEKRLKMLPKLHWSFVDVSSYWEAFGWLRRTKEKDSPVTVTVRRMKRPSPYTKRIKYTIIVKFLMLTGEYVSIVRTGDDPLSVLAEIAPSIVNLLEEQRKKLDSIEAIVSPWVLDEP